MILVKVTVWANDKNDNNNHSNDSNNYPSFEKKVCKTIQNESIKFTGINCRH